MQYRNFRVFLIRQIGATRIGIDFRAVFALLNHFADDGLHFGIVRLGALVHFKLLNRRVHQTDGGQRGAVFGFHGGFHVFG